MKTANLTDLAAFSCLATHLNFRRAAEELRISPSALSHRLRGLEERLGIRLLNRTTRSVSLTEAGVALFNKLQPALATIDDALEAANIFRTSPTGTLRIAASRPAIQLVLAPLIGPFIQKHPGINLEIVADSRLIDIVEKGFDAGIRLQESLERDMIALPIGPPHRLAIVASPSYFAQYDIPKTPNDLVNHRCLNLRFQNDKIYRWEFEKNGRELTVAVNGPLVMSDQYLMIQAVKDGAGLACLFEAYAKPSIEDGSLVRVLEDWCPPFPGFFLYYSSRRQMSAGLRAFIDMAKVLLNPQTTSCD